MDDTNLMDIDHSFIGPCEVCGANEPKYTCPKCEVKTCCLKCVRIHKKELNCDGIRDKTKFIKINTFTNLDLLSDYRLLQDISRNVESYKSDKQRRYRNQNEQFPLLLLRLRAAATRREMILKFLPPEFSRRKCNTTSLDWKLQIIYWKIEWIFPSAANLKCVDEKCLETDKLSILVNKYLEPGELQTIIAEKLQFYSSVGINGIQLLLKAEEKRGRKFYPLDSSKTLMESLKLKIIIENPTIYVILKPEIDAYDLINPEDEYQEAVKEKEVEKMDLMKRLITVRTERQKRKTKKNLLFTTGYSDEESINGSDSSDNESSSSDIKIPKRMLS